MNFKLVEEYKTIPFSADTIIDAIKYAQDTEKTLYSEDGKPLYSIYFDCDKNDELLSEYNLTRDENLQFIYKDEKLNQDMPLFYTEVLRDTIEGEDYIKINLRDYNINKLYNPCYDFESVIIKAENISRTFNIPKENILINDKAINNMKFHLSDIQKDFELLESKENDFVINSIDTQNNEIKIDLFITNFDCYKLKLDTTDLSNHLDVKIIAKMDNTKIESLKLIHESNNFEIDYNFTIKEANIVQNFLDKEFNKTKKLNIINSKAR